MAETEMVAVSVSRQQQRSDTDFSIATLPPPSEEVQTSTPRQANALSYMHRPPTIMPNYGKKNRGSVLPKSNVSRVLLYDNITQQSMLDVRLNSIQSQSHKTHRELEMHMKSFLTRRKARQKALKHLTRVQHHDDYMQFQLEQQQLQHQQQLRQQQQQQQQQLQQQQQQQQQQRQRAGSLGSEGIENGASPTSPFLPQIGHRSSSFHPHLNHPSPGISSLRKHAKSTGSCWKESIPAGSVSQGQGHPAATANGGNADYDNAHGAGFDSTFKVKLNPVDTGSVESLPQIALSAPSSAPVGKYQALAQEKRVGYRMVKGAGGYTRIFHSLPEGETGVQGPRSENKLDSPTPRAVSDSPKPQKLLPLRRGVRNRRNRFRVMKHRDFRNPGPDLSGSSPTQPRDDDEEQDGGIPDREPEEPLNDFRFLHLRKLLIPQEPPNEGYTELSPSFPRRYPDIKDVVRMDKNNQNKTRRTTNGQSFGGGGCFGEDDESCIFSEDDESSSELSIPEVRVY